MKDAIGYYALAIDLRPDDADYRYARGNALSDQSEYPVAIEDYNEALRLVPRFANAYYNRGIALRN